MVIQLDSKRKAHVLARLRAGTAPVVALWARQRLIADAAQEVAEIARRVSDSSALWTLARDRGFPPTLLGCLLGVLVEARQAELLAWKPRREIRSIWRVDPAEVEKVAEILSRLAESPVTDEATRALFRLDAQKYEHLAVSMRARDDLPHGPGRPRVPASVIEDNVELIFPGRPQAERRALAAALASDFLGAPVQRRQVASRQRARVARQRRGRPRAERNK